MKYKIIIQTITETEYPETSNRYVNKKTKERCMWDDDDAEIENYKTGKMFIRKDEDNIYEQTVDYHVDIKGIIDAFNKE